jgi:transmembrane sensor
MNTTNYSVADLLSQESFINYCKNTPSGDVNYWEEYIKSNPGNAATLEEAKEIYMQLFSVLASQDMEEQAQKLRASITPAPDVPVIQMDASEKRQLRKKNLRIIKIAAAIALVITIAYWALTLTGITGNGHDKKIFVAANGERKNFQLPDGSFITLNAGSTLEIKEAFGTVTRDVYLKGEAFFDVKHNDKSPFIVHTAAMDVKALGTAFNVKAYQGENTAETALIRGLVEVTLKEDNNLKMLLYPNQKIKWNITAETASEKKLAIAKKRDDVKSIDSLRKSLVITEDGIIKEIAWKSNKLVFDNEQFNEIAHSLERWYGARIIFKDSSIRSYRFTGVFEKEDLNTVLGFLQESRNFNYTVVDDEPVTINLTK